MDVNPSTPSPWVYLPLHQAPAVPIALPLLAQTDGGGPVLPVLCEPRHQPVLEPYLQQLRSWQGDPISHPQPVIPVITDTHGLRWFSPEGAAEDQEQSDP